MELQEIVFETLGKDYARGRYGVFDVIVARTDCFINATKLCALGGKRFDNWLANKQSKELIATVASLRSPGIPGDPARVVAAGPNVTRGTYVHPLLIPHIACWVSPSFAIKVSHLVNEAIVREHRAALASEKEKAEVANVALTIERKKAEIASEALALEKEKSSKLEAFVYEIHAELGSQRAAEAKRHAVLMGSLGEVRTEATAAKTEATAAKVAIGEAREDARQHSEFLGAKVDTLAGLSRGAIEKIEELAGLLDEAAQDQALPPDDEDKHENLAIIRRPGEHYGYRFACLNAAGLRRERAKMARREPPEAVVLELRCVPNATALYQRLAARLEDRVEFSKKSGTTKRFRLLRDFTEAELLSEARDEHAARKGGYPELAAGARAWGYLTETTVTTTVETTRTTATTRALAPLSDMELAEVLAGLL